jgi:hypothetical protein
MIKKIVIWVTPDNHVGMDITTDGIRQDKDRVWDCKKSFAVAMISDLFDGVKK